MADEVDVGAVTLGGGGCGVEYCSGGGGRREKAEDGSSKRLKKQNGWKKAAVRSS